MRKIYCFTLLLLFQPCLSFAQSSFTWIGGASGDYQLAGNWTPARNIFSATDVLQFNANSTIDILNVPNQTIGAIGILSGTSVVSFASNATGNVLSLSAITPLLYATAGTIYVADALTISLINTGSFTLTSGIFGIQAGTGGKIIINSILNLNGAKLDFDVAGTSGTTITGSIIYTSGIFNCANASAITWTNNANYFHAANGTVASSIPISNWQTGATCTVNGFNAGLASLGGLTTNNFSNLTWNCPAQINDIDLNCTKVFINGTFSVISTNNKYIRMAGDVGGIITAGAYNQTSGNIMLQSGAGNTALTIAGNFSQTGGILDGVGGSSINGSAYLGLQGAVTKTGTWQVSGSNPTAQMTIDFSGLTAQLVNLSGTWSAPVAGRCNVTISNTNLISGVTLTTGTKLKIFSNATSSATCLIAGLLSVIDASASVIYNNNCTLQYAGTTLQNVSNIEFPLSNGPANLAVNNSLGINFPAAITSRTISGILYLMNGNIALGSDTLFLTNPNLGSQINYTNGYISTGVLGKYFATTGLPTTATNQGRFPFGSGANDRSLNIYFSSANLSAGIAGMIYVSHTPVGGVTSINPAFTDNGVLLDKKANTNWYVGTGSFTIGAGAETINITATGANIGSVDNYTTLRLTDGGTTQYGTALMPNPAAGNNAVPITGKSGLTMANINKALYIASDGTTVYNPLINITFNWTGLGGNTDWTNAGNWTGINAVGYPSASTENAVINSTSGTLPTISSTSNISVYQLTVGAGMTLTMAPGSNLNVNDTVVYNGIAAFDPTSTFAYASSYNTQKLVAIQYGNLSLMGIGTKVLPAALTITGNYTLAGSLPIIGTGTIIYAGAGDQRIAPANYYNLTITGNRLGRYIIFGTPPAKGIINIANNFDISGLSNYNHQVGFSPLSYTDINFSSAGTQTIPGIYYPGSILNTGNGARILDNAGSADPNHVIYTRFFKPGTGNYTNTGSKVNFYVTGLANVKYSYPLNLIFNDLEISGDNKGYSLDFFGNPFFVSGDFKVSLTNYSQPYNNTATVVYMGTANQTINAYKTIIATNTPAFKYPNIVIQGANRNVKLAGSNTDSIPVMGSLQVPRTYSYNADYGYYGINLLDLPFAAGKGFIVDSSSINFIGGSSFIPKLFPVTGSANYNNLSISGGTQLLDTTNITIGGNLFVGGNDLNTIAATSPAVLKIGNGSTSRILNVMGNVGISGISSSSQKTGQIDLNPGSGGSTILNIYKNLSIAGQGQLMSTGALNGSIVFKGLLPHTYQNTGAYNNDSVNFNVGDGVLPGTRLSLQTDLDLIRSNTKPGTITIGNGDTLDCTIFHIKPNNTQLTGSAKFNLQAGATLITANTGGIEGAATAATNGTLINDGTLIKNYDSTANYIFNASNNTNTNFPAYRTPFPLANVCFGDSIHSAIFSLNKSIDINNSVKLQKFSTLSVGDGNYLNLKSTAINTAMVLPVPDNATIIYGTGRFVVERYFSSRRAWRLVTAPVTADAGRSIFNAWQLGGIAATGCGTFISGPGANSASNGLDITPQNKYSLKLGSDLTPVANTKTTFLSGTAGLPGVPDNFGMFLFVRGDRSSSNLFNINYSNTTTLRDTGFIQIHQQTFSGLSTIANGISLIGNPFASPVDFSLLTKNNIVNRFWVWDPYINNSVGAYVEFDDYANTGTYTLSTPTPGGLSKLLQSSQAFFVQTAGNGPASLVIKESHKTPVINNNAFREHSLISSLRTNLFLINEKDSGILADGNLVEFGENFKSGVTIEDAPKFNNIFETLGLERDHINLAIERRPFINATDTLFFKLTGSKKQAYKLQFEPFNMKADKEAFLEDNFTGLKTAINLQQPDSIFFSITDDVKTAAEDRFKIIFQQKREGLLKMNYNLLKATRQGKNISLNWSVLNEAGIKNYDVEKLTKGNNFIKINALDIYAVRTGNVEYSLLDENIAAGKNTYRIKAYDFKGNFYLSKIISAYIDEIKTGVSIFPNPVIGNTIGLAFNNMEAGQYQVKLINTSGQILFVKNISHLNGVLMEHLDFTNNLAIGFYEVEVKNLKGEIFTARVNYGR